MRLTSRFYSFPVAFAFCVANGVAQLPAPGAQPEASAVISAQIPDTHEDQSTTRSVSQIRIVRLSQVRGQVQLDRSTGQKLEAAFTNLPIISGAQLRTQEGVAEVEFEDNSSLRLVMDSQVEFSALGRDIDGRTTTTVNLLHGSIYVSLASNKTTGDFNVRVGRETLILTPSSHIRVDMDQNTAKLTVFQGAVTAASDAGSVLIGKRKAITFDLAATAAPVFAHLGEPSPLDQWDKNAVEYHKSLAVASTYANSPYSYGVNDLAYYGAFSDVGGCGTMWRPYLATASFDPYASGVWSWYPSSGYSWVSPYPWGWTPYHSGSWSYCASGGGWGWQPQGGWNGLQNVPSTTQQLKMNPPGRAPIHAPLPPVKGQPTIVAVNLNQLQPSKPGASGDSFVFQRGSAGLGVPRGVFNNLEKMSQHATQHGFATASISENQAARGLMPTYTASRSSAFDHGSDTSVGAHHNTAISNSASSSRSFSTAAPSSASAGAPANGGAHH